MLAMCILIVSGDDLAEDLLVIRFDTLLKILFRSALGSGFCGCGQIDLDFRMRKDNCTDVAAIQDITLLFRDLLLDLDQTGSDTLEFRYIRSGEGDLVSVEFLFKTELTDLDRSVGSTAIRVLRKRSTIFSSSSKAIFLDCT